MTQPYGMEPILTTIAGFNSLNNHSNLPSTSVHHDSIMADMLAGQWYASVCGLPRIGLRDFADWL